MNLTIGVVGLVAVALPGFVLPAIYATIFHAAAGVMHMREPAHGHDETIAMTSDMTSDLFMAPMPGGFVAARFAGLGFETEIDRVAVSSHPRIEGQGLGGGGAIPVRDNHSPHILRRRADGHRLIVSEMFMDANTEQSYAAHS